jgi:exodeoxyribonuclease-3
MKLISWNVNGLRAAITKEFDKFFKEIDADIFSIQETKMQEDQITDEINNIFNGYYVYWNSAVKKGYSGTAVFTKKKPINVTYGIGIEEHDQEGRIITLEFEKFYLVDCYTPNSKRELERLDYRMEWEDEIRQYLKELKSKKSVILCGDLNVAHEEIDLKNPSTNHNSAGFTDKERNKMTELLNLGFIDTFRYLYPEKENIYSWWSYMFHAREKNAGWRIDYFIVSDDLKDKIEDSKILTEIMGSDHCPVELDINVNSNI